MTKKQGSAFGLISFRLLTTSIGKCSLDSAQLLDSSFLRILISATFWAAADCKSKPAGDLPILAFFLAPSTNVPSQLIRVIGDSGTLFLVSWLLLRIDAENVLFAIRK
jgi:hypothetical protein